MDKKLKLMVDMDDVLVYGGFEKLASRFSGKEIKPLSKKGYYIQDLLGDKSDDFIDFVSKSNIYDHVQIFDNCKEVLEILVKKYDIYITTAYILKNHDHKSGLFLKSKFDFLVREFPFLDANKFIFTNSKSMLNFDIRIDDRLTNLLGDNSKKILFKSYHNQDIPKEELEKDNIIVANDWLEIKKMLL